MGRSVGLTFSAGFLRRRHGHNARWHAKYRRTRRRTYPGSVPSVHVRGPGRPGGRKRKWTPGKIALWAAIALLGGVAWFMLAIVRGETVNAIWFVFASVCTYLIGYRFYSKVIERYLLKPERPPRHPGRVQGRRQGLCPHRPQRPVRPPLCRHRRRRPARRSRPRGPDGLPARHYLDHHRRRPCRRRPGLPGPLLLHAPRRPLPGPDGPRGTRTHRRHRGPDRHAAHHGHHRRHPRPRRRQRSG